MKRHVKIYVQKYHANFDSEMGAYTFQTSATPLTTARCYHARAELKSIVNLRENLKSVIK
jgi:hypothetical protein